MDMKLSLLEDIKQEEPVEYYLISPLADDQLNVGFDPYSPGDLLEENHQVQVKQECLDNIQPIVYDDHGDSKLVDPLEFVKRESDNDNDEASDSSNNSIRMRLQESHKIRLMESLSSTDATARQIFKKNRVSWDESIKKKKSSKIVPKKENDEYKYISIVDDDLNVSTKGPPYTCNICSLTFPIRKSLIFHRTIHKGKTFQCELCKHVFKSKSHIKVHMKIHLEPKFSCPVCPKSFALEKSFRSHQLIHEERKFECDICKKRFRQKGQVKEHMKVHRERIKSFQCEVCDLSFYEQRTLNRHMKYIHSDMKRKRYQLYRCPNALCDKSYASVSSFQTHICVNDRRPLDMGCSLCSKRFFNKYDLNRHSKQAHFKVPDNSFRCSDCGRTFLYRCWDSYILHVAQKCAKLVMYECDYCSKLVPSKAKLMKHFTDDHGIDNIAAKIKCPKCTKFYFNKKNLIHHLKKNHIERTCAYCNHKSRSKAGHSLHQKRCIQKKTFEKYSQLDASVATDRSTGSTHACEICKCSFITKANLLEHQTVVHVEKNFVVKDDNVATSMEKQLLKNRELFKCPTCQVTFISEELYQEHFQRSNCENKRPRKYQCTVCSKIYRRNSNLMHHFRKIHLNERVGAHFVCDICERSFASKRLMLNHLLRGDHRNSLQCEFCSATFKHLPACWKHSTYCKLKPQKMDP